MEIKGTLVEKTSKAGNPYQVIMLQITDTYQKPVFLDPAELELLKAYQGKQEEPSIPNFF